LDNGEWMTDAKALVDAGSAAFKAANAKDVKLTCWRRRSHRLRNVP
jgi:hypothetical protein